MDANPFFAPPDTLRRGACPTLAAPMAVADGLLARLRAGPEGWSPAQWAALARAAGRNGNGLIEVSVRGSVQVRGLWPESEAPFRAALEAAGIEAAPLPSPEASPIAGRDRTERADPRPIVRALSARLARHTGPFAPKLAIVCDAGGAFALSHLAADILVTAVDGDRWQMTLANTTLAPRPAADVPDAFEAILDALVAHGPRARARDLDADALARALGGRAETAPVSVPGTPPPLGLHPLADGTALVVALPFGQVHADALEALARAAQDAEVTALHPGPERTLTLLGPHDALDTLAEGAALLGFWTRPDAPGLALPLCSGAEIAGDDILHAARLAAMIVARAPNLADGTVHLHVSTCAKGCGHKGAEGLRLSASKQGFVLTSHADRHQTPLALLGRKAIEEPIDRLAASLRALRPEKGSTRAALAALVAARSTRTERAR